MTNQNNRKQIDPQVRACVDRYETMLFRGQHDYFDEDDLLDVADYYYNDMSRKDDALACLDYILALHPNSVLAVLMKAEILFSGGRRGEAWSMVRAIDDQTDQDVLYYCGLFSLEEGKLNDAEAYYRKAYFAQAGGGTELFVQIVWDYLDRGITDGLDLWFEILPQAYRSETGVLEARATYLQMCGKYTEAIAVEEKLIDSDPYNVAYWVAISKLYFQTDNYAKAHESIEYALDISPADGDALLVAASVAVVQGNHAEANRLFEKYISIDDKNGMAYFDNAKTLAELKRYDEALVQLNYALKYSGDDSEAKAAIYNEIAATYWDKEDLQQATLYNEKARKAGIGDEYYYSRKLAIELTQGEKTHVEEYTDILLRATIAKQSDPSGVMLLLTHFKEYRMAKALASATEAGNAEYRYSCCPCLAFIALHEKDIDSFFRNLKYAVEYAPDDTARLLSAVFPPEMDVKDYYNYALANY